MKRLAVFLERHGALLAAVLITLALFGRTLTYDLVWDDHALRDQVTARPGTAALPDLATGAFAAGEGTGYYRPVTLLSLWVDEQLGHGTPLPYHLTNLLLHLLVLVLLWQLLTRWLPRAAAAAGLLVFAVHPVHVEAVAFVAGRTDLWAALGCLLAARLLLPSTVPGASLPTPSPARTAGAALAFALACLAKEVAFPFLVFAALAAWWAPVLAPVRRRGLTALAAGATAAVVLRLLAVGGHVGLLGDPRLAGMREPLGARLVTALQLLVQYLKLLVAPWPLHAWHARSELALSAGTVAAAVAGGVVFASAARRAGDRTGWLPSAWFLLFLAPVLGIVPLGGSLLSERFLYLPSLGFAAAAALLWGRLPRRWKGPARLLAAAWLALLAGIAWRQVPVWRDDATLFRHMADHAPTAFVPNFNEGKLLADAGAAAQAIPYLRRAVQADPSQAEAWAELGIALGKTGRSRDAWRALRRAAVRDGCSPRLLFNLGSAALMCGQPDSAVVAYRRAVALDSTYCRAWTQLGGALLAAGRPGEAADRLERARRICRNDPAVLSGLAMAYHAAGRDSAYAAVLESLERLDPRRAGLVRRAMSQGSAATGR